MTLKNGIQYCIQNDKGQYITWDNLLDTTFHWDEKTHLIVKFMRLAHAELFIQDKMLTNATVQIFKQD